MKNIYKTDMTSTTIRNAALIFISCLGTYLFGKDINWDFQNYHFYIAHAAWTDRFHMDYMAAGPNSYFNPYADLPFYWMVEAGWHSLTIGLVLGAFHGINLILLWELSARIFFKESPRALPLTIIAVSMGVASLLFLGTLGGTLLEPSLSVFVLGGLLLLVLACENPMSASHLPLLMLGGLLMGMATGFKLTNIIFIAAGGLSVLFVIGIRNRWLAVSVAFGVGAIIGYVIINGWWGYKLYREFGNPFFPFFNEIFQSPDFSTAKLDHDRFKITSLSDFLVLPFRMASVHSWIYIENNAPDLRPAILALLSAAVMTKALILKLRDNTSPLFALSHPKIFIIVFLVFGIIFWTLTTGNGRYGLPIFLLVGPVLTALCCKFWENTHISLGMASLFLILQIVHILSAGIPRWGTTEWTKNWLEVQVPQRLKDHPYAYMSIGFGLSNSIVAPFLHPKSAFVSISGVTYSFRPDGPGNNRFFHLIQENSAHLRMLVSAPPQDHPPTTGMFSNWDDRLLPWGLKIVRSDCESLFIILDPIQSPSTATDASRQTDSIVKSNNVRLFSCALQTGAGEDKLTLGERQRLTAIFDKVEEACPLLFSPRGWQLTKSVSSWQRAYLQSDIIVSARNGRLSLSKLNYGPFDVDMGSYEEWESGRSHFVCQRLPRPW